MGDRSGRLPPDLRARSTGSARADWRGSRTATNARRPGSRRRCGRRRRAGLAGSLGSASQSASTSRAPYAREHGALLVRDVGAVHDDDRMPGQTSDRARARCRCCPDVASTMVPPGASTPVASAVRIMLSATRSFDEPPGLRHSSLTRTRPGSPRVSEWSSTTGVLPTSAVAESRICVGVARRPRLLGAVEGHHESRAGRPPPRPPGCPQWSCVDTRRGASARKALLPRVTAPSHGAVYEPPVATGRPGSFDQADHDPGIHGRRRSRRPRARAPREPR